jgi:hypothetical protein
MPEASQQRSRWLSEARATPPVGDSDTDTIPEGSKRIRLASLRDAGISRGVSGGVARFAGSTTGYAAGMPPASNHGLQVGSALPFASVALRPPIKSVPGSGRSVFRSGGLEPKSGRILPGFGKSELGSAETVLRSAGPVL